MEFTEKNIEQIKYALMTVIARFTSDVNKITIVPKESFAGKKYLSIETDDIWMNPRMFKSLRIQGEADMEGGNNDNALYVSLMWRWESFSGGSNGIEFASFTLRQSFDEFVVTNIRLR